MAEKVRGKLKWFSYERSYGFINGSDGRDYFVHRSELKDDGEIFKGDEVEFNSEKTEKGFQATDVTKIKN